MSSNSRVRTKKGVGGPTAIKKAAKRRTDGKRSVGPTLSKRSGGTDRH